MRPKKPERNVLASADVDQAQVLEERQPFHVGVFFFFFSFDAATGTNCVHFLFVCRTRFRKWLQMLPTHAHPPRSRRSRLKRSDQTAERR